MENIMQRLIKPGIQGTAHFDACGKVIDRLLSENRTKRAIRCLRALMGRVLYNISDLTPTYISQIQKRWGSLIDVDSYVKIRNRKRGTTFEEHIALAQTDYREDPEALELISEFESAVAAIDSRTSSLGLECKIRSLMRMVDERLDGRLSNRLMILIVNHFDGLMNFTTYFRRRFEAREAKFKKEKTNG
jgi:hypothetical protein